MGTKHQCFLKDPLVVLSYSQGWKALIYIFHSTGQSLLSEFQNGPTCAGHEVGMWWERVGRLRGGAHSLVRATDPAQMGRLRNNTQQAR